MNPEGPDPTAIQPKMHVDPALEVEFPGLRVAELVVRGLTVRKSATGLEALKATIYEEMRKSGKTLETVKDDALFKAYRDFYWKVGIDPTKTRPAAEALTRRVLGGKEIPAINTLVDACNLVSLKTSIAIAAFDCAHLRPEALNFRRARAGESFLGIGMSHPVLLEGIEAVIEDTEHHDLAAFYPFRNAERSKVTESTRDAFLLMCGVPGVDDRHLERAKALCQELVVEFCRASNGSGSDAGPGESGGL